MNCIIYLKHYEILSLNFAASLFHLLLFVSLVIVVPTWLLVMKPQCNADLWGDSRHCVCASDTQTPAASDVKE